MDEADFLDRTRRVAEAFRPAAPIDRRDLFSGRGQQIADLFSVVAQPGQHAVGLRRARRRQDVVWTGHCGAAPRRERPERVGDL